MHRKVLKWEALPSEQTANTRGAPSLTGERRRAHAPQRVKQQLETLCTSVLCSALPSPRRTKLHTPFYRLTRSASSWNCRTVEAAPGGQGTRHHPTTSGRRPGMQSLRGKLGFCVGRGVVTQSWAGLPGAEAKAQQAEE